MELYLNAINYCADKLKRAIDNEDSRDIIESWRSELRRWNAAFLHYCKVCNP